MSISLLRCAAPARSRAALLATTLAALLAAPAAYASFLSGDAMATAANYLAVFIIIVVPIVVIVVFWLVHILPEKIAHKRHHPQRDAIQVLCLLSLVFGGLLWPLAWLWAYTKPVLHKMAYGTDKHDDYYAEHGAVTRATPASLRDDVARAPGGPRQARRRRAARPSELDGDPRPAGGTRAAARGHGRRRHADGTPPARHLQLLRLADLHQVQVAALEHDEPGHGRDHPDRRARRR